MKLMDFLREEDGMGTAEVVIIAAVLVAVALVFRDKINEFVKGIMNKNLDATQIEVAVPGN